LFRSRLGLSSPLLSFASLDFPASSVCAWFDFPPFSCGPSLMSRSSFTSFAAPSPPPSLRSPLTFCLDWGFLFRARFFFLFFTVFPLGVYASERVLLSLFSFIVAFGLSAQSLASDSVFCCSGFFLLSFPLPFFFLGFANVSPISLFPLFGFVLTRNGGLFGFLYFPADFFLSGVVLPVHSWFPPGLGSDLLCPFCFLLLNAQTIFFFFVAAASHGLPHTFCHDFTAFCVVFFLLMLLAFSSPRVPLIPRSPLSGLLFFLPSSFLAFRHLLLPGSLFFFSFASKAPPALFPGQTSFFLSIFPLPPFVISIYCPKSLSLFCTRFVPPCLLPHPPLAEPCPLPGPVFWWGVLFIGRIFFLSSFRRALWADVFFARVIFNPGPVYFRVPPPFFQVCCSFRLVTFPPVTPACFFSSSLFLFSPNPREVIAPPPPLSCGLVSVFFFVPHIPGHSCTRGEQNSPHPNPLSPVLIFGAVAFPAHFISVSAGLDHRVSEVLRVF